MPTKDDVIDRFDGEYEFLSNFYPSVVILPFDKRHYATVEHGYQASKTMEDGLRDAISFADGPGIAKRIGRSEAMKRNMRPYWDSIKKDVMLMLLRQKFGPGSPLREKLLATGSAKLVEGNWWGDEYWGVCNGKGLNVLGQLLMRVRDDITVGKGPRFSSSWLPG